MEIGHVRYIPPHPEEPIRDYATRLSGQIDQAKPFALVGHSLGGILAVEIAKQLDPVCTILIGSIPISAQLPRHYSVLWKLGISRMAPVQFGKIAAMVFHRLTLRAKADRRLMRQVVLDGDNATIRWAMNAVIKWNNSIKPSPLFQIHGHRDRVFPINRCSPTHPIKGDHNLVITDPATINGILAEILLPYLDS
jgi:pimeloyl-ACP methyl ester carboxylesterase